MNTLLFLLLLSSNKTAFLACGHLAISDLLNIFGGALGQRVHIVYGLSACPWWINGLVFHGGYNPNKEINKVLI